MRILVYLTIVVLTIVPGCISCTEEKGDIISSETLLKEMTELGRLTLMPEHKYKIVQFSSYDRSSKKAGEPGWFSNSDGFGEEPVPGFEGVLREPDASGTGEYLVCDIRQPGAILRLWTAGINGRIRIYLDNMKKPVFEGNAQEFFWKTIESLAGAESNTFDNSAFRQADAIYFPIPFSERCRIEWIGNIKEIHFYHITARLYPEGTRVRTFKPSDIKQCRDIMTAVAERFNQTGGAKRNVRDLSLLIPKGRKELLFEDKGTRAIEEFRIKLSSYSEEMLRKCILTVYFDDSSIPDIEAPLGDFFGTAPGWAPYHSIPFSVLHDSTMICRFIMPYRNQVKIEIKNLSTSDIRLTSQIGLSDYEWIEDRSMHFNASWRIDHGLVASDSLIRDIPYLRASGRGRLVGAAAFLYNPSNVPTSWGNWWGEGDEKIFVDADTFPSVFGTGTEDYFNYSWSSEALFAFPFCGQTRNDGPGNRGYVSNYRWHISDDIPFYDNIDFSIELWHHGVVPNFSYGRIVYYYSQPVLTTDNKEIIEPDVADLPYLNWLPEAYLGSEGYKFIQIENLLRPSPGLSLVKGNMWAGGSLMEWHPSSVNQKIRFSLPENLNTVPSGIGITLANRPSGGEVAVYVNDTLLKFSGREYISLNTEKTTVLRNYFSEKVNFKPGINEITLENRSSEADSRIGIDFIWLKENISTSK